MEIGSKSNFPDNVHVFQSEVEMKAMTTFSGVKVHIYGSSYGERHVFERKCSRMEKTGEADYHIGMLHGHCENSPSAHQPYSPFTKEELLEKGFDYWALGHIHQQQILWEDPHVVYPGNIQGRHKNEMGPKGFFAVRISDEGTKIESVETADIVWENTVLSVEGATQFNELYSMLRSNMDNYQRLGQGVILSIQLNDGQQLSLETLEKIENGELIDVLQDEADFEESFVWVNELSIKRKDPSIGGFHANSFLNELEKTVEGYGLEQLSEGMNDLYSHPYARRYLEMPDEDGHADILQKAERILTRLLQE